MTTRRLGRDGPEIAAVGYGAMSFSDFYGATTEANCFAILDAMRDWGSPISTPRMSMAWAARKR